MAVELIFSELTLQQEFGKPICKDFVALRSCL